MRPTRSHLLGQFLLFAAAATFAVFLGVWLHGAGTAGGRNEPPAALTSLVAPPQLRDSPGTSPSTRAAGSPLDVAGPPVVKKAIPISAAVATGVALASLQNPEHETIAKAMTLEDALRESLTEAAPLPYVYQAVLMNDCDWLERLLKGGFPVDDLTPAGDTALCAALKAGNLKALELLLKHRADPNKPGRDGQPPVALASLRRSDQILTLLLDAGADANAAFVKPVPDALLEGVINREFKSSLRSDTGVTALMAVAARGDVEGTMDLLKHGAKTNLPTKKYFRYPINFAAEQRYIFLMRLLLGRPADSEPDVLVTVDLSQQKAYLQQYGRVIDKTSISTGREGYGTPPGRYLVTDKHKSWTSTIYKVAMPWFMRLNCGSIGLHAGYVTGEPASHGCIRLPSEKARKWFDIVKVGDEVQIVR